MFLATNQRLHFATASKADPDELPYQELSPQSDAPVSPNSTIVTTILTTPVTTIVTTTVTTIVPIIANVGVTYGEYTVEAEGFSGMLVCKRGVHAHRPRTVVASHQM